MELKVGHSHHWQIASVKQRIVAAMIDLCIYIFLSFILALIFIKSEDFIGDNGSGFSMGITMPGYIIVLWLFIWILSISLMEFRSGQTIGKRFLKIKVVKQDFTVATFTDSLVRHLFDIIDIFALVGLFVTLANNKNQRIGDQVARTIVIRKD
ncbi:MAG: RDD family protein [Saprospiraceae bacterium]|nr:RDD family protein [Saprospiraceae bacterium]